MDIRSLLCDDKELYQSPDSEDRSPFNPKRITSNQGILDCLWNMPRFKSREQVKSWVFERLNSRGINLVIERSDNMKIIFKCKTINRKALVNALGKNSSASGKKTTGQPNDPSSSNTITPNGNNVEVINKIKGEYGQVNHERYDPRSEGEQHKEDPETWGPNQIGDMDKNSYYPDDGCSFRLRFSYSTKCRSWIINYPRRTGHNPYVCCNFGDLRLHPKLLHNKNPDLRADLKLDRPEHRTENRIEYRPEPKSEQRTEQRQEPKQEQIPEPEPEPEAKSEPRQEPKREPKREPKKEHKREQRQEPRRDHRPAFILPHPVNSDA